MMIRKQLLVAALTFVCFALAGSRRGCRNDQSQTAKKPSLEKFRE